MDTAKRAGMKSFRMRAVTLLFVFAMLIAPLAGCADKVLTAADMLTLGEKYLLEMEYEQALVQFFAVIEIDPKNVQAYLFATEAYIALGEHEKAEEILRKGYDETGSLSIEAMINSSLLQQSSEQSPSPESSSAPMSEPIVTPIPEPSITPTPEITVTPVPTPESTVTPTPEAIVTPTPEPTIENSNSDTAASVNGGDLTREMLIGEWKNIDTGDIITFSPDEVLPEGSTQQTLLDMPEMDSVYYILYGGNTVDMFSNGGHLKDYGYRYDPETQILTGIAREDTSEYMKQNPDALPEAPQVSAKPDKSVYADIIAAYKRYQDSGFTDYSSPLIADSFLVIPQSEYGMTPQSWDASHAGAGFYLPEGVIYYSLFDLNGDSLPELMIGFEEGSGNYFGIFGVYSADQSGAFSVLQRDHGFNNIIVYDDASIGSYMQGNGFSEESRYTLALDGNLKLEYSIDLIAVDFGGGGDFLDEPILTDHNDEELSEQEAEALREEFSQTPPTMNWNKLDSF